MGHQTHADQPQPVSKLSLEVEGGVAEKTRVSSVVTVIFAGVALMSDGYNAAVVGYTNLVLGALYGVNFTSIIKTRISNAYLIGEIIGMLAFGMLIDRIGRKAGVMLTTFFLILGVSMSAASHGTTYEGMFWMLIISRGIAGVGAGGEYPVCGVSATEAADENEYVRKNRGFLIGMIGDFAIDFGFVLAGLVVLIVIAAYGATGTNQFSNLSDGVWRVSLALGVVPPLIVFYARVKIINSTAFRKNALKDAPFPYMLVFRRYWKTMIGTCLTWFLYDFVAYPFGLFSSTIISQLSASGGTTIESIGYGTLINSFYLPGCVLGAIALDRFGRRQTQFWGFFLQAIVGFVLGGALGPIQNVFPLFIVMYGIFVSLGEFGPGVGTILIANESYPTFIRGHMVGLSAAVGKAGAAIGTQVFTPIQASFDTTLKGQQAVFLIGAGFAMAGALVTWFFVPEMARDLETEDIAFRLYLEENGYDTSVFGDQAAVEQVDVDELKPEKEAASLDG